VYSTVLFRFSSDVNEYFENQTMKRKSLLVLLLLICMSAAVAQDSYLLSTDLQSLVDAERAFSRTATEKGVRDSFLAFIADDGILYRPGPVNGKQWLEPRPARPGLLTWQPVFADISAAGDMGVTTGPWEFRAKSAADPPVGYGQFATVWRKQSDGSWKFAIDIGISHEKPAASTVEWTMPASFAKVHRVAVRTTPTAVAAARTALLARDSEFSKASLARGAAKAFLEYSADELRFLRDGAFPIIGKKKAHDVLAKKPGSLSWQPEQGEVSVSGDLGYTHGTYEFKGTGEAEKGFYMRVWKMQPDGSWRVVLDVFNEGPKPGN
jgi:ketosteroid isomerase-like protein